MKVRRWFNAASGTVKRDVEMALIGYSYNQKQYFSPENGNAFSPAIKESNVFRDSDGKYYLWEDNTFLEYTDKVSAK